jgi:hypothetical protein
LVCSNYFSSAIRSLICIRTTLVGPNCGNELTYLLAWESLADREKKWDAFFVDPEWVEARSNSEKDGPINEKVASSFLTPTKFSALQ